MDLGISGKVALVLGGGGGLGGAIGVALAREGVRVALASTDGTSAERVAQTIRANGGEAISLAWDLNDLGVIDSRIADVERQLGSIAILINNTGGPPPTTAAGQPSALWAKSFQAMVLSVIAITDRVLPGMIEQRWGRIITSTSSGAIAPIANLGISNALRATLVGWSKTLAREVADQGITANIVVPGRIATARVASLDAARAEREDRDVAAVAKASIATIPAGRYGDPEEYGDVVTFLASARSSYVTGSVIRVDGGLIASI